MSFIDFIPLVDESIETVRGRIDSDANAGVDPTDDRWLDTTPGGYYWDLTQSVALEIERLWDFLATEVPAAALPQFAFGTYLDEWGEALNVPRKDAAAAATTLTFTSIVDGTVIAAGTEVATVQTEPDSDAVIFATTAETVIAAGTADAPAVATVPGATGNVAAGALSVLNSPVEGVDSVTNINAAGGGADVESDEAYQARILLEFSFASGSGTADDYVRWALSRPGVGGARVEPLWNGAGTVRVILTSATGDPVSPEVIADVQAYLDPVAGQGAGRAPIGASVTVDTPATLSINVAATIVPEPGYSLDGTGATTAITDAVTEAMAAYINQLPPKGEISPTDGIGRVLLNRVRSQVMEMDEVYNVSALTLNGVAGDVTVGALQVPRLGTVTLT